MAEVSFKIYMKGIQDLLQIVQDLEKLCIKVSQTTDVEKLDEMYSNYFHLHDLGQAAIIQIEKNDYSRYEFDLNDPGNLEAAITAYKEYSKTTKKKVQKIKEKYKEYEIIFVNIYTNALHNLTFANNAECLTSVYVTSKNKLFAGIRQKRILKKLQAKAKIKEADAMIAATEKAQAEHDIEKEKTEQLRLQAEERKAREEAEILPMEERYRMMFDEFMNTVQGNVSDIVRQ